MRYVVAVIVITLIIILMPGAAYAQSMIPRISQVIIVKPDYTRYYLVSIMSLGSVIMRLRGDTNYGHGDDVTTL